MILILTDGDLNFVGGMKGIEELTFYDFRVPTEYVKISNLVAYVNPELRLANVLKSRFTQDVGLMDIPLFLRLMDANR